LQWGDALTEVPVNPDGRFQVEVPPEPVAVLLLPFGTNKPILRYVHAKSGQKLTVQFELPTPGAIEGQVVHAETGRPVAGALVQLIDETGLIVAQTITNRLGIYRFEPILPGRYSLRCRAEGLAIAFRHNVVIAEGTRIPVDFVLSTGGTIVGQVKAKSKQIASMYVMLNADSNFMSPVYADGRFRIDNITPGRHILMLFRLGDQIA
ncbi:MAG: carboxypeptidase-like regulatory domain-containing protein, partial [Armatimonadota bacterium]|nr:carboxypeptidase-like regulatory domain-containing protein [Armatimonadota bacterium]MDW8144610.1 carboxypeptidase-like regulatory domain-containing protein [Armatimonadota bacterium]